MASKKTKKYGGLAILAIIFFVAVLFIGEQGNLFQISTYGGATQFYLSGNGLPADSVPLYGSRSSAEILAPCAASAEHRIRIVRTINGGQSYDEISTQRNIIGAITYSSPLNKYLFSNGASVTAFRFDFQPTLSGDYKAFESIQCSGSDITNLQTLTFTVSPRPTTTPTIVKYCGAVGANVKTRSCYYHTCEVQANGNWDWSAEKQSSSFCDAPPPTGCTSDWRTTAWDDCGANGQQVRASWDNNQCQNPTGTKPAISQGCTYTPPVVDNGTGGDGGTPCAQVITPAKNVLTGDCFDYPTPCAVPFGWATVDSCATTGTGNGTGSGTGSSLDDFINTNKWYIVGGVIVVFAWLSGLIYYLGKKK